MWFEDHLKGTFNFPAMPQATLVLRTENDIPVLQIKADPGCRLPIKSVDVHYSYERQPQLRFWADGGAARKNGYWEGRCPTFYDDEPLFAFANVTSTVYGWSMLSVER